MRRLLCIPIIHDAADMGSAGELLAPRDGSPSGRLRGAAHGEIMDRFWEAVAVHLRSQDPGRLKLYQDGMPADGDLGKRIVREAAKRGSKNYQLLWDLLSGGAELRKTEDPALLLEERKNLLGFLNQAGSGETPGGPRQYRAERDRLMAQRDAFIARTINETLGEGELGVLFIGAHHNVAPSLAGDIAVQLAKEPGKVRAYFEELLFGNDDRRLQELGRYLTAPIESG
jgi:hypothetical protein